MSAGFEETLERLGMTEEDITLAVNRQLQAYGLADIDLSDRAVILASPLHGRGAFAARQFLRGEVVLPVRIEKQLTYPGQFINHSNDPSCDLVHYRNGDHYLVACRVILEGEELTHDYAEGRHADV